MFSRYLLRFTSFFKNTSQLELRALVCICLCVGLALPGCGGSSSGSNVGGLKIEIEGSIIDADNMIPVSFAEVFSPELDQSFVTDEDGTFLLEADGLANLNAVTLFVSVSDGNADANTTVTFPVENNEEVFIKANFLLSNGKIFLNLDESSEPNQEGDEALTEAGEQILLNDANETGAKTKDKKSTGGTLTTPEQNDEEDPIAAEPDNPDTAGGSHNLPKHEDAGEQQVDNRPIDGNLTGGMGDGTPGGTSPGNTETPGTGGGSGFSHGGSGVGGVGGAGVTK